MATFTTTDTIPDSKSWTEFFQPDSLALITTASPTTFGWTNPDGSRVVLTGSGFTFDGTAPLTGTVTGFTVTNASNQTLLTAIALSADLQSLFLYAFGTTPEGEPHDPASGYLFLSYLMLGNDTFNGGAHIDYFSGGNDRGNDTVNGGDGSDFIKAYAGRDLINGGNGTDTLSYQGSYDDTSAYKGVVIKVAAGTVQDCWGSVDTFTGVERFRGSKFADKFTGGTGDDAFQGLGGNDTVNGGAGIDELGYYRDGTLGGTRGIIASFVSGTVKDGFGNTDTFSGIEKIIGTNFADSFFGDDAANTFIGASGRDTFDGGLGVDTILFDFNAPTAGAVVDLTRASGQIQNDGFGNVENALNVENFNGTKFGDNFKGNAAANEFHGGQGVDTIIGGDGKDKIWGDSGADLLTGGLAADTFYFSKSGGLNPFADHITDFITGLDRIAIYTPDFAGMTGPLHFQNAPQANGEGSWFFYSFVVHGLYWDRDGMGTQYAPILLATLDNVDGLVPRDILLFS